ncbi:acyltransferase [Granulicella mallensis]|uniref:Peptidoglycan/LPS O-acetylase OafA/YrhL n=1 Tax=Granulicella mallensis TaxID=940614 RepID=A0A7W8EB09_9BACT|nr:acyltransferase [Granulicella mallensis]MBB5066198.1 peptidoglycan/LPS O-acetylase OafA/YrhL [Granulicella mallensis]
MKKSLGHVNELDGLRGIAASIVLIFHLFNTARENAASVTQTLSWRIAMRFSSLGTFGVDIFFVLSGFLITSLLLKDKEEPAFFWNFYWKRVLRIQPVYLVHLLVMWLLIPGSHGYVILALAFIVNFDEKFHVANTGPAWTLSIEEQFYLLWPQVIRRFAIPNIYRSCIALMVLSAGLRTYMLFIAGHAMLRVTWYRFDGLAMGALLACEWMTEGEGLTPFVCRFLKVFHSRSCLALALIYEIYILAGDGGGKKTAFILLTTNYLVYRVIRYILYHPGTRLFRWLRSAPLLFLGSISYSLYMYHGFFLYLFDRYMGPPSYNWLQFFCRSSFVVVATLLVCTLSLYGMERPIQNLRRHVLRR